MRRLLRAIGMASTLVACLFAAAPIVTADAPARVSDPSNLAATFNYDSSGGATTSLANPRTIAFRSYDAPSDSARPRTRVSGGRSAAKAADEAAGGVYSLRDGAGNVVRTGRSKDLARREAEHARDPVLGRYRFQPEFRTNDYATQRGLEQLLHDDFLPALNKIRPISARNPRFDEYMEAGRAFRGGG